MYSVIHCTINSWRYSIENIWVHVYCHTCMADKDDRIAIRALAWKKNWNSIAESLYLLLNSIVQEFVKESVTFHWIPPTIIIIVIILTVLGEEHPKLFESKPTPVLAAKDTQRNRIIEIRWNWSFQTTQCCLHLEREDPIGVGLLTLSNPLSQRELMDWNTRWRNDQTTLIIVESKTSVGLIFTGFVYVPFISWDTKMFDTIKTSQ